MPDRDLTPISAGRSAVNLFRLAPLALLLGCALPAPSSAQETPGAAEPFPAGTRVRVFAPDAFRKPVAGQVTLITPDTLFLTGWRGGLVAVPIAAIARADLSRGRDHWKGAFKGAGISALAGGGLFGVIVFVGDPNCDYCLPGRNLEAAAIGAAIGATLAAPVGAFFGGILGTEKWEPTSARFSLAPRPEASGLDIRLTVRVP
jgi:hypothetical protein